MEERLRPRTPPAPPPTAAHTMRLPTAARAPRAPARLLPLDDRSPFVTADAQAVKSKAKPDWAPPEIPPKKRSYLNIQLRDKHQAIYDKANDEFEDWLRKEKEKLLGKGLADFEVERVLAAEALVKVGYLRRLVGEYKVPAAVDPGRSAAARRTRFSSRLSEIAPAEKTIT